MKQLFGLLVIIGAVVLGLYHALIYYDNNFRYGRMRETPAVKPHEEPLLQLAPGIVPVHGGDSLYRAVPADRLAPPIPMASPETINRGRAVYFTFCAQCHGRQHDGNGTVGQSFMPLPTDLRSAKVQATPTEQLFKSISYGIPNGRQPPLDTTITVNDRWSVVGYVKSLGLRP